MDEYIEYLYQRVQALAYPGGREWENAKAEYSRAVAWVERHG